MNSMRIPLRKHPLNYLKAIHNVLKFQKNAPVCLFTTSVDVVDSLSSQIVQRTKEKNTVNIQNHTVENSSKSTNPPMTDEERDNLIKELMSKNRNRQLETLVKDMKNKRQFMNEETLKKLFKHYSLDGKPEMIIILQKYCANVDPNLYQRNVEFLHYLAKAHCFKGNSERGLSILTHCYRKYEGHRSFYRLIFRELIQDSVLNRSEASLIVFKKYVLNFSEQWSDHYPLICFWYICWSSNWFSDQMLSNELLETSEALQDIIRDKAMAFSITVLNNDYNEDAVLRLLQNLLKHKMMEEYSKVLQVLFNYKLKNRDVRGCTEIVRNCQSLGISLSSDQQGRYITLLINGSEDKPEKLIPDKTKLFKFKF